MAAEFGLKGGYCQNKAHEDERTGRAWDFTNQREQAQLWGLLDRRPPKLLMASPSCTAFSSLQRVTKIDMPTSTREQGLMLLKVAVKVCMLQVNSSNVFIFEYPVGASSWKEECVIELVNMSGVQSFVLDQCMKGLESQDREGRAPTMKTTRILTNATGAEKILSTRCDHRHRHVERINNKAQAAEKYPR